MLITNDAIVKKEMEEQSSARFACTPITCIKRLSTIESCKNENLCWMVLLIFELCRYFGNIPIML